MAQKKSAKKEEAEFTSISNKTELKNFLISLQDKLNGDAAPIYAVSAMNHILNLPNIYDFLDTETREMMRAIWLKLKASGANVRQPPILFGEAEKV